jgi:hypothetical protein
LAVLTAGQDDAVLGAGELGAEHELGAAVPGAVEVGPALYEQAPVAVNLRASHRAIYARASPWLHRS